MIEITPEIRAAAIAQGWTPPPQPVDPLLVMAREIYLQAKVPTTGWAAGQLAGFDEGDYDSTQVIQFALIKLREAQALVARPVIDREAVIRAVCDAYDMGAGPQAMAGAALRIMEGETND